MDTGEVMANRLRAAEFVNVTEKRYKCLDWKWAKKQLLKEAASFQVEQLREGMEAMSPAPFLM